MIENEKKHQPNKRLKNLQTSIIGFERTRNAIVIEMSYPLQIEKENIRIIIIQWKLQWNEKRNCDRRTPQKTGQQKKIERMIIRY